MTWEDAVATEEAWAPAEMLQRWADRLDQVAVETGLPPVSNLNAGLASH
jgi:hypothetical protein